MTGPALPAAAVPPDPGWLAGWVADVISALGLPGVAALVALENVFPPVPSEVVLPLAGFLSGRGAVPLALTVVAATVGSVVGALVLYAAGRRLGRDRLRAVAQRLPLVHGRDVDRAGAWFDRYGDRAVLFGRVVPLVRSGVSIPAGVARMPLGRFVAYTAVGSAVWNAALIGAGYALGSAWQSVGPYSGALNNAVLAALALAAAVFVVRRLRGRRTGRSAATDVTLRG